LRRTPRRPGRIYSIYSDLVESKQIERFEEKKFDQYYQPKGVSFTRFSFGWYAYHLSRARQIAATEPYVGTYLKLATYVWTYLKLATYVGTSRGIDT
jgi:hypothetical protein